MTDRKTIINEVVLKTTAPMIFNGFAIVNQSEVTITTEVGPKILEPMSFHAESQRAMTSTIGAGTSEMTIIHEREIGSSKERMSVSVEKTNTREAALVMIMKTNSKGRGIGEMFLDDSSKVEMRDIGKPRAGKEIPGRASLLEETDGDQIFNDKNFLTSAADVKDLVKDHVIGMAVIPLRGQNITGAGRLPPPTDRCGDHPRHMVPLEAHTASWSVDEAFPQGVVEKKVIDRVLLEIRAGMAWGESRVLDGLGTQHPLMTVAAHWIVDEETHPLLDSMQNVGEVHLDRGGVEEAEVFLIECDRLGTDTKNLLVIEEDRGSQSVVVRENTHVNETGPPMRHVIAIESQEESSHQDVDRDNGRREELGVQDGLVAHHVIVARMSRRKYRVIWRKNGDADQPMKMSGSMRKIYQRAKETKRQELKEKENGREKLRLLFQHQSLLLDLEENDIGVKPRRRNKLPYMTYLKKKTKETNKRFHPAQEYQPTQKYRRNK